MRWFLGLLWILLCLLPAQAEETFSVDQISQARAAAWERKQPIAWLSTMKTAFDGTHPAAGTTTMTELALKELSGRAVIILDVQQDDHQPPFVHQYLYTRDDPDVPPPHTHFSPKIIFTDPSLTKYLTRLSYTEMRKDGDVAFESAFNRIISNPDFQASLAAPLPPLSPPAAKRVFRSESIVSARRHILWISFPRLDGGGSCYSGGDRSLFGVFP